MLNIMVECEKQLLFEENKKLGNVMQTHSCRISIHLFYEKSKSDKTRELSDLKFIPQT